MSNKAVRTLSSYPRSNVWRALSEGKKLKTPAGNQATPRDVKYNQAENSLTNKEAINT